MKTVNKQTHTCGCGHTHTVSERQIPLTMEMVQAMVRVAKWAEERGIYEFKRKEFKHLMRSETETATFGNLVYFGGIFYKNGRGNWGINIPRYHDFIAGRTTVPLEVWKNPITGAITHGEEVHIKDVPHITKFLDEEQEYITLYRDPYATHTASST